MIEKEKKIHQYPVVNIALLRTGHATVELFLLLIKAEVNRSEEDPRDQGVSV